MAEAKVTMVIREGVREAACCSTVPVQVELQPSSFSGGMTGLVAPRLPLRTALPIQQRPLVGYVLLHALLHVLPGRVLPVQRVVCNPAQLDVWRWMSARLQL
jgi:hypothetical protein